MSYVYLDIETEWLTHADVLPRFVVCGHAVDDGPVIFTYSSGGACKIIMDAIRDRHTVVLHRGAFEMGVLQLPRGLPFYDTAMVATIEGAARGDPDAAGHSLKSLGSKAGYAHPGGKGKSGLQASFRFGQSLTDEQLAYLRADVECTRAVHKWQRAKYGDATPDLQRQTEWSRDVFELGRRGLHIDQTRLAALMAKGATEERQLQRALVDTGIVKTKGTKKTPKLVVDQATVQALLRAAGVTDVTEGSECDNEEDQLLVTNRLTLIKTGDPRLKLLADYGTKRKHNGLLKAYAVDGGVVRARYNSLVATGRMSCSSPNVQQVPKRGGLRECWTPSPGHVLIEADYAMLELYTFADTCARWGIASRLREALNEGQDVHTIVAAHPAVGTRALAKVFNYGGLGGMGAETMQENIEKQLGVLMPVDQIQRAQAGWKETWPEVEAYWRHNTIVAHPAGFKRNKWGIMKMSYKYKVTNPQSGRQRLAFYCAAQNFGFQGPGGDIIKHAMDLCHRDGQRPVAALHDQLLCEVEDKPHAIEFAKRRLAQIMKAAGQEVCPNVRWPEVDVHVYRERWESKGLDRPQP